MEVSIIGNTICLNKTAERERAGLLLLPHGQHPSGLRIKKIRVGSPVLSSSCILRPAGREACPPPLASGSLIVLGGGHIFRGKARFPAEAGTTLQEEVASSEAIAVALYKIFYYFVGLFSRVY